MAKRQLAKDDYESDGGFVEDAPKSKKQKKQLSSEVQKDADGNEYWEVRSSRSPHSVRSPDKRVALWQASRANQRVQGHHNGWSA